VKSRVDGEIYCDKTMKDTKPNRQEVHLLKHIHYPHIVTVFGSYTHKGMLHVLVQPVCDYWALHTVVPTRRVSCARVILLGAILRVLEVLFKDNKKKAN
jgi:hypothetical protein